MTFIRFRRWCVAGLALGAVWLLAAPSAQGGECESAAERAEQRFGIPTGLLAAIGMVESGHTDATGRHAAWPWSVQAESAGRLLPSAAEAIGWVEQRQRGGVRSIDVGCFQVNLLHHPGAFAGLAEAFDPDANAAVAAAFLVALRRRLGGWETAVGAYHSNSPDLGPPYMRRVYATWQQASGRRPGTPDAVSVTERMPAVSDTQPRILHLIGGQMYSRGPGGPSAGGMPRIFRGGLLGPNGRSLWREG